MILLSCKLSDFFATTKQHSKVKFTFIFIWLLLQQQSSFSFYNYKIYNKPVNPLLAGNLQSKLIILYKQLSKRIKLNQLLAALIGLVLEKFRKHRSIDRTIDLDCI